MESKKPKIMFYDIETTPLRAYIWRLGKQVVRHHQLDRHMNEYKIICIAYCFNDGKKAKALIRDDYTEADLIQEFDNLVSEADIIIGKNSNRFDNKHMNAQRMMHLDYGDPEWLTKCDDLEKQIRKYFILPSYSLDYLSTKFGLGGKNEMVFSDWLDIISPRSQYLYDKALKKMVQYGKKDVEDTRTLWLKLEKHFKPRFNHSTFSDKKGVCDHCGSKNLKKNGFRYINKRRKQAFYCKDHMGHAGYNKD